MVHREILTIAHLVANDRSVRFSAILVVALTLALGLFLSPLAGLVVLTCYVLGFVVCWCLIKYQSYASFYLQEVVSFFFTTNCRTSSLRHSCSVCDDLCCDRNRQGNVITPWKHLYVDKELNDSLEHFYNKILEDFILAWFGEFSDDQNFINELRVCLRHTTAAILNRVFALDCSRVISTKLLPCAVKHVDDYLYMQQIMKLKNARLNDVIVEYLGKRLHAATTNRKNELAYLQSLSSVLLPHILPEKCLQCRNFNVLFREILAGWVLLPLMDVLADPGIINSLVILAITHKPSQNKSKAHRESVEILEHFVANEQKSSFATSLNEIKGNTDLLYAFLQFLKREEHVHLLQFCLNVDEFNNKLLTPDLSKRQLEELHSEAMMLYKEYLNKESPNFIGCPNEIVSDFYTLIKDGVYHVAKLRTSKPLYQAYEHTFNVLEKTWLPSFFHSNEDAATLFLVTSRSHQIRWEAFKASLAEKQHQYCHDNGGMDMAPGSQKPSIQFYSHICGSKLTAAYNKASAAKSRKYYEAQSQGTVAKISSGLGKIKGALKTPQPIEGSLYPSVFPTMENGTVEDVIISDGSLFRDMSSWKVSITSYQSTNKVISFCVNVQKLDGVDDEEKQQWVVLRKDQDFYTLKAKLVEFHGESEICDSPLPSRKAGSPLDMRMSKYEEFLKRLLRKPTLRGSDLLHTFLTTKEDFTMATTAQSVQDIGNIYQSVAHKLRKEKGQHLDSFMTAFLASTGNAKKFEWAEMGDEIDPKNRPLTRNPPIVKTFRNHVFNDNFGVNLPVLNNTSTSTINPVGVTECLFYLLKYIFKVPHYVLRMYAAICSVAQDAIESFFGLFIERTIKSSLSPTNLSYLIKLLEDAIFLPRTHPTKKELEIRRARAFEELEHVVSPFILKLIGDHFPKGLKTLLEVLQNPHYNKQLVYNLLDLILVEMYPNLVTGSQ